MGKSILKWTIICSVLSAVIVCLYHSKRKVKGKEVQGKNNSDNGSKKKKPAEQLTLFPELDYIAKETLIIIGNGFDRAHDIKSSYWDFREWLIKKRDKQLVDMMDIFFSNQRDVWSGIEQALGEYDEKAILEYCRPDEEFDLDHSLSSSARVEDSPNDIFQPVLEEFKNAFHDWVDSIVIDNIEKKYSLDPCCRYLTFNYTDTLETRYAIPASQIAHIHGSRLCDDEYVVGHNNHRNPSEAWEEDGIIFEQNAHENIIKWMNELTKCYHANIAKHRAFFDSLRDVKQIITYGHSMANVDWPYFEEIIKIVGTDVPWRVSCYSKDYIANTKAFKSHFNLTDVTII